MPSRRFAVATNSRGWLVRLPMWKSRWREFVRILYARIVPLSQNIDSLKAFFLSTSSHARLTCSEAYALATVRSRYQLSRVVGSTPYVEKPMAGGRCEASALLVHPNASHFGTGLRTNTLKTIINRFLNARCPLRVRLPMWKKPMAGARQNPLCSYSSAIAEH